MLLKSIAMYNKYRLFKLGLLEQFFRFLAHSAHLTVKPWCITFLPMALGQCVISKCGYCTPQMSFTRSPFTFLWLGWATSKYYIYIFDKCQIIKPPSTSLCSQGFFLVSFLYVRSQVFPPALAIMRGHLFAYWTKCILY